MELRKKSLLMSLVPLCFVGCGVDSSTRGAAWVWGVTSNLTSFVTAEADPLSRICDATSPGLPAEAKAACSADHASATITFGSNFPYSNPTFKGLENEQLTCPDGTLWNQGFLVQAFESVIHVDTDKKVTVVWYLEGDIWSLPSYRGQVKLGGHFKFTRAAPTDTFEFQCEEASNDAHMEEKVDCSTWKTKFESVKNCLRTGVNP